MIRVKFNIIWSFHDAPTNNSFSENISILNMKTFIRNLFVRFMNRNDFSNQKIAVTSIAVRTFWHMPYWQVIKEKNYLYYHMFVNDTFHYWSTFLSFLTQYNLDYTIQI